LEALVYDMPLGLTFRKAVLWHDRQQHEFSRLRESSGDSAEFRWSFQAIAKDGVQIEAEIDGRGPSIHRVPYLKTDCSGSFEVVNNSLAKSVLTLTQKDGSVEELHSDGGTVLEMGGIRRALARKRP